MKKLDAILSILTVLSGCSVKANTSIAPAEVDSFVSRFNELDTNKLTLVKDERRYVISTVDEIRDANSNSHNCVSEDDYKDALAYQTKFASNLLSTILSFDFKNKDGSNITGPILIGFELDNYDHLYIYQDGNVVLTMDGNNYYYKLKEEEINLLFSTIYHLQADYLSTYNACVIPAPLSK